jgi:beta-lactamase class A
MALWLGDGTVMQATAYGIPSTQVTSFEENARLKERFRYARRLAALPGAPRPGSWNQAKRAALEARLKELAAASGARFGIVFKELTSGASVKIGESHVMHAASTMKTAVLVELLRRLDAGTLKWTDELEVKNEFRSVVDGSTFTVELDPASEGPVTTKLGERAPIGFLIVRSSNLATNLLLEHVGAAAIQKLLDDLGAGTVHVRRGVSDEKAFDKGISNETDAAGMATLMETAVRSPKLSESSRKLAWDILAAQTFNEEIPAGIPSQAGVVVAHKTGSISTVQHDAGVVRLPDGREYVLVLLSDGFKGEEARKGVLAAARKMSRAVWEAMIAP